MINNSQQIKLNLKYFKTAPNHFGYGLNSTICSGKKEHIYVYYSKMDYVVYNTVYRPVGRYLYKDFNKLYNDVNVRKAYSNNNIVYLSLN